MAEPHDPPRTVRLEDTQETDRTIALDADASPRLYRPNAAAFTEEAMLRPVREGPRRGWRRWVHRGTFGRINLGPGPGELAERALTARVGAPIAGSRRIAVISRKGGVGKTTTTLMLGHTFATWRSDRVVALDADGDAGTLKYRLPQETSATVTTLLADRDRIARYADVRAYTSQAPSRLEVVASDDDPGVTSVLGGHDYRAAITILDRHYNLILIDTSTGLLNSGVQGVLSAADQLVIVLPAALDGARAAASTLDWLERHGYEELVTSAVAVVNRVRHRNGPVELERIEEHFEGRCWATVRIPWDRALEPGAQATLDDLRPATRMAFLDVAAAVADGFAGGPRRRTSDQ